ncbi:MAG: hypothetical protein ACKOHM_11410 [Spartobacteria bacterium]
MKKPLHPDPSDPMLDSVVLAQLAKSRCEDTKRAVALNPNARLDVLRVLWLEYPECVLENPVLMLWEVTSPSEIPDLIGQPVLLELFNSLRGREEPLPEMLFSGRRLGLLASAALDECNAAVFKMFPIDSDPDIRKTFIQAVQPHPRCEFFFSKAADEIWRALANDPCEAVVLKFAELLGKYEQGEEPMRPVFIESTLALAGRKNPKIQQTLARCAYLPSGTVDLLIETGDARTRALLTGARLASLTAQLKLAGDPAKAVRLAMAKAATQAGVLRAFRMDDDPAVLKAVLANKKTPNDVRCRIVREAVPEVQEVLCDSANYLAIPFYLECKPHLTAKTRAGLCQREGLHAEILLDLVHDVEESVRMAVALDLEAKARTHFPVLIDRILNDFLRDPSEKVRLAVIKNNHLSEEQIHRLLCDASENVRAGMAGHLLEKLADFRRGKALESYEELYLEFAPQLTGMAGDPSQKVRLAVAAAAETPPNAFWSLYEDSDPMVAGIAARASCLPLGYYLDEGAKISHRKKPSRALVKNLAQSGNPFLRHIAAKSPHTTIRDLRRLSADANSYVAEAAAHRLEVREYYNGGLTPVELDPGPELAVA